MESPIFLMCSERSGSNLITRILDAHPEICGPSPSHIIRILGWNRARYGDVMVDANWDALLHDTTALMNTMLGVWRTRWESGQLAEAVRGRSLESVIDAIYDAEAAANGKMRLMIKENHLATLLPMIVQGWPDARFVFMTRDPRDMAVSWKGTGAIPGGVDLAAKTWQYDQRQNLIAYNTLYSQGRVYHLKYEDLLQQPESVLADLCVFLGVAYDAQMLAFYDQDQARSNAARINAWRNLEKPLMTGNVGKYMTDLAALEVRYVEAVCAREMTLLGYRPEEEPRNPEELEDEVKRVSEREAALKKAGSDAEEAIRERRLAVIRAILSRPMGLDARTAAP